ncbi:hypothetical protein HXA35_01165 [Bacillus sp. A301a_S52]|nr:hypothetical protein [Bacillus sp. A301a_S52]
MKSMVTKGVLSLTVVGLLVSPVGEVKAAWSPVVEPEGGGVEIITDSYGLVESEVPDYEGESDAFTIQKVESGKKAGGYWIRGKKKINDENKVYSKYKHYKKEGRASVVNGLGDTATGKWQPKDEYSVAHRKWTFRGTNKAYYNSR